MTLKDKILLDLTGIQNPNLLNQVFEFIQILKNTYAISEEQESNKSEVLKLAGILNDEDAQEMKFIINTEFNQIEGEW
ncbi:MAG: hypothetical protein ACPG5B_11465 [Chitinophagales bacterium]